MSFVQGAISNALIFINVAISIHIAFQKPSALLPLVACIRVGVSTVFAICVAGAEVAFTLFSNVQLGEESDIERCATHQYGISIPCHKTEVL